MSVCGWQAAPGLFTDFYQLTMAHGYWRSGMAELDAYFSLSFREDPFEGGFTVACGLEQALDYLTAMRFEPADLDFLATRTGNDGAPLFDPAFLEWLADFRFLGDVDAVPEGTLVFPGEPIVSVTGPIIGAQLAETALLNIINFQSLVATKAARVCLAAAGDPVVEFGLRRAQGPDGGMSASRAAYVGGCTGTSNVLAARTFGIPEAGTHAHSWVMAFDDERAAFDAYADAMPNNCTFLVDTFDTLEGVRNAVSTARGLEEAGHRFIGIRIDSGDLAWLSRRAREILDEAGFSSAKIVASNELDEHLIESLKDQGAAIDVWGVGTKLVTAHGQPALGGVYKLSAVRRPSGEWQPRIKLSEQSVKTTVPGVLGVRRYVDAAGSPEGDMVYDTGAPPVGETVMFDPADPTRRKHFKSGHPAEELLVPVIRAGRQVYESPRLEEIRRRTGEQVARLDPTRRRFLNPHTYPVGLEQSLHERRQRLILEAKGLSQR
jgi:nicotinate phosphoribosyltransferase